MDWEESFRIPRRGYVYVILAAVLWAVSGSSAKFLFNRGVTPFQVVQLRLTIAVSCLFLFLLFRYPRSLRIAREDIVYFIILGVIGMAGVQFAYLYAISKIHVAVAILLEYLAPVLIAIHAVVFTRDRLEPATLLVLAGATIGCYLAVGAYNLDILAMNASGIVSGFLSAVAFAWYSVHSEYGMRRYSPWTVLFYAFLVGAIVWNALHPPFEAFAHSYASVEWAWILYIGVLGTLVPFALYLQGISLIRSTRASITAILEPITAGTLSWAFLGEAMEGLQLVGATMIIASLVALQLKKAYDEETPSIIRANRRT